MRNWRTVYFVIVVISVASGLGVLAQSSTSLPSSEAKLSYSVGDCEDYSERRGNTSSNGVIGVWVLNQSVIIRHDLRYACCAMLKLDWHMDGNLVSVTETNTGDMCRCVCSYQVNATVGPLSPGKYTIMIYGVAFQNVEPDILAQQEIKVAP